MTNVIGTIRFPLFHMPIDVGAGSGGGQPSPAGGQPGSGVGPGSGQGQSGTGGPSQFSKFDPEAAYDFGDGKPVKGSDYLKGFVPRSEHDKLTTNYTKGRDLLIQEAAKLQQAWEHMQRLQKQGQGQQGQGQRPSPLDKFKDLPVVDGAVLAEAYQAMREGDIAPILQVVRQQQAAIQQLSNQMKGLSGGYGTINEQQQVAAHSQTVDSAISSLGEGFDPKNALLRDLADDVYLSHDPKDPNLQKEFPAMLKSRIEGLRKLFREMDKATVEKAKSMKRTFTRPGSASPNGAAKYVHENGSTLARRLFGESSGQAT